MFYFPPLCSNIFHYEVKKLCLIPLQSAIYKQILNDRNYFYYLSSYYNKKVRKLFIKFFYNFLYFYSYGEFNWNFNDVNISS